MATSQAQDFTVDGTFLVPAGVSSIFLTMVAGGGGGGAGVVNNGGGGGGGGSGEFCRRFPVRVAPGASIAVVIGVGGLGSFGIVGGGAGAQGTPTSFGTIRVEGGWGGSREDTASANTGCFAGAGGNGGGVGGWRGTAQGSCVTTGGNHADIGYPGVAESPWFFGGSGGGGGSNYVSTPAYPYGRPGGSCEGIPGGPGGVDVSWGGAGGGASCFGTGGSGGIHGTVGYPPPPGSYGAGGGGTGGVAGGVWRRGGSGANGYVLVEWIA